MTAARKAQIGLLRLGGWVRPPLSLGTPAWARPPLFVLVGSLAILFLMKSLCDCILECGYLLIYLYRAAEAGELKSRACWCRARRTVLVRFGSIAMGYSNYTGGHSLSQCQSGGAYCPSLGTVACDGVMPEAPPEKK